MVEVGEVSHPDATVFTKRLISETSQITNNKIIMSQVRLYNSSERFLQKKKKRSQHSNPKLKI